MAKQNKKIEKKLLFEDSTLADVVNRFSSMSPVNTGANKLSYEISHYLFDKFKNIESDVSVNEIFHISEKLSLEISNKYMLIDKNISKKYKK